jgi:hypothetical protein
MGFQLQICDQLGLTPQLAQLPLQGPSGAGQLPQLRIREGRQVSPAADAVALQLGLFPLERAG